MEASEGLTAAMTGIAKKPYNIVNLFLHTSLNVSMSRRIISDV